MAREFIVGMDLDGCLVNNYIWWNKIYQNNHINHNHPDIPLDIPDKWNYHRDICRKCWDHCLHHHDVINDYRPKAGAAKVIQSLVDDGMLINTVTSRPSDVAVPTYEWVREHLPINGQIFVEHNKAALAIEMGMNIMVDDAPRNIEDFQQHGVPYIIYDTKYNKELEGPRVFSLIQMKAALILASKGQL